MKKIILSLLVLFTGPMSCGAQSQAVSSQLASPSASSGPFTGQIIQIASASSCSSRDWSGRGQAPSGYANGMALSFARSLCRYLENGSSDPIAAIMSAASTGETSSDALAYYSSIFSSLNIPINQAGPSALRAIYVLAIGVGVRESSGEYCTGWDTAAGSNRPSSEGEAGLFQTSYDSINASPELQNLYTEYQGTPGRCWLDIFSAGASCPSQGVLGTGAGAAFQAFEKSCPAFSTEYAIMVMRILRTHYGSINEQAAQVEPVCNTMLETVETLVQQNSAAACQELQ